MLADLSLAHTVPLTNFWCVFARSGFLLWGLGPRAVRGVAWGGFGGGSRRGVVFLQEQAIAGKVCEGAGLSINTNLQTYQIGAKKHRAKPGKGKASAKPDKVSAQPLN